MNSSLGWCVQKSIELECTAPKLGNVFPGRPFEDMTHDSFLVAAKTIGGCVDRLYPGFRAEQPVAPGDAILQCTRAMLQSVGCNTSLGTILLVVPLVESFSRGVRESKVPGLSPEQWQQSLHGETLQRLDEHDSQSIYEAIRVCNPGGLGSQTEMDVASSPPAQILDAMAFAASYDDVALQYVSRFDLCFRLAIRLSTLVPSIGNSSILDSITLLQLELLADRPDSLIARKGGIGLAEEVRGRAEQVLDRHRSKDSSWMESWEEFDAWMRSLRNAKGKRLANPGTHADLIAAAILIYLLQQFMPHWYQA